MAISFLSSLEEERQPKRKESTKMTRKLKMLGVALLAASAISAVAASVASAVTHTIVSEVATTTLTGAQVEENKFTVVGQVIKCKSATFTATLSMKEQTEVTGIAPTYSECTYGANPMTVTMRGCTYVVNGLTDANGDALTKVNCPAGVHITMDIPALNCEITLKETAASNGTQTLIGGVKLTNQGEGTTRDILLDLTATFAKISRDYTGGGAEPAACSAATGSNLKLTGTITLTGQAGGVHTGIFFK
jgi:hypothetical protein